MWVCVCMCKRWMLWLRFWRSEWCSNTRSPQAVRDTECCSTSASPAGYPVALTFDPASPTEPKQGLLSNWAVQRLGWRMIEAPQFVPRWTPLLKKSFRCCLLQPSVSEGLSTAVQVFSGKSFYPQKNSASGWKHLPKQHFAPVHNLNQLFFEGHIDEASHPTPSACFKPTRNHAVTSMTSWHHIISQTG